MVLIVYFIVAGFVVLIVIEWLESSRSGRPQGINLLNL